MAENILLQKSDELAHEVYNFTKDFPKEEIFGLTSQLRRAALSVPLNITEGFARQSGKSFKQFLLISFGSIKEVQYLLGFSLKENYLKEKDYRDMMELSNEVAKMLWVKIQKLKDKV